MQRAPPPPTPMQMLAGRANLLGRELQDKAGRRVTLVAQLKKLDSEFAAVQERLRELQARASRDLQQNQRFVRR